MKESDHQPRIEEQPRIPDIAIARLEEAANRPQGVESLESLMSDKLEEQIRLLRKLAEPKPKDRWEKFAGISTFLSTVVIALVGTVATLVYNSHESERNQQMKKQEVLISETQAVKELIPQLTGPNKAARRTALLTLCSLNNVDLATRLAPQYATDGGVEALEDLNKRITEESVKQRVNEALAIAYRERGHSRHYANDYKSAIQDYSKAIEFGSFIADNCYSRALSYLYSTKFEESAKDIEAYYQLSKDEPGKYYLYGLLETERRDYNKAIEFLDQAIKLQPWSEHFYRKGVAERLKGDWSRALDDYSRAINYGTNEAYYYQERAVCRERLGDEKGAKEDRQMAEKLIREKKERLDSSEPPRAGNPSR